MNTLDSNRDGTVKTEPRKGLKQRLDPNSLGSLGKREVAGGPVPEQRNRDTDEDWLRHRP